MYVCLCAIRLSARRSVCLYNILHWNLCSNIPLHSSCEIHSPYINITLSLRCTNDCHILFALKTIAISCGNRLQNLICFFFSMNFILKYLRENDELSWLYSLCFIHRIFNQLFWKALGFYFLFSIRNHSSNKFKFIFQ